MVNEEQQSLIQRGPPEAPGEREAYVVAWHNSIKYARDTHFKDAYNVMDKNMKFVRGRQWSDNESDERYVCNLVLRFLQKRTAMLYAKNPRAIAEPRKRMEYAIWDEKPETLAMAQQSPNDPLMQMLLHDVYEGSIRKTQFRNIAKTLEYLYTYYMSESRPSFKQQIKQLVRRVLTCGVGYVKIGFQRDMEPTPDQRSRVKGFMDQLQELERITADYGDEEFEATDRRMEELRVSINGVMQEQQSILHEGLVLNYPRATEIIPDINTIQLQGFIGSDWIAQEYYLTKNQVQAYYKTDIGDNYECYHVTESSGKQSGAGGTGPGKQSFARVWEVHDILHGAVLHLCDGYKNYLRQETTPSLVFEQGHPFHALAFNEIEDSKNIFPPADVSLMRDQQMEYNRSRECLREHRIASKPAWISPKGMWGEMDVFKLGNHLAHELIQLNIPFAQNMDINKLLISKPTATIDPNVYDVEFIFTDILRSTGDHEAAFGGSSGDTATEVSVAEQSRVSSVESNIDDLDEFLTATARDCGQILLLNMGVDEVKKIVGPGAVWPEFSAQEAASEIMLEIQAGSSGRPNRAQDLANMERVLPYLVQIPGINPRWLGEDLLNRMDDKLDLSEAFIDGQPSILALNAMSKAQTAVTGGSTGGGPPTPENSQGTARGNGNQPNQQGDQGGNNSQNPQQTPPGPQPAYPAQQTMM
jgi:hypothetical protein